MVTMSAREFNQSVAAAQRSAADEPVIVTRRGEPAFVLMRIEDYRRLTSRANPTRLSERLAPADGHDLDDIEFPRDTSTGRDVVEF
ncbi:type II toxin-antitoxin system Phd/YefM family antitoxin [Microbacterium sp. MPKO10]|uniref:type II toxin-antitoxin system Phd/YefM family antitoxin n=1 Tax=Microbacterium sp. MPKO10 TaxID=2989818 RepID=UPI0022355AC3|nr:type II toxin-antitoxin system Phd/YefM family antitoxin [Microbacterium sp. MPKO10]MCW4457835.1 type II toxin-antitoxin system Phd/YefM family antitoxin [Microbacterium sp. MPKO10]